MSEQSIPKPKRVWVRFGKAKPVEVDTSAAERFVNMPWYSDPVKRPARWFTDAEVTITKPTDQGEQS